MNDYSFLPCEPSVVSEVIDGEAIIMDMASGVYFSADGLGAVLWAAATQGVGVGELARVAEAAYPDAAEARAEVEAFFTALEARKLVARCDALGAACPALPQPYERPNLAVHEDMQDLIQLDPIHDVDQTGWPVRKLDDA